MPDAEPASEERKLATVLFADLVGSTALADEEDPERTRLVLNRFYDAMTEEIERCGGTVEKFVGDAVMAAFGAPAALEDHAERALHAALAMERRLTELFGDQLALRIGVNTGDVVVGRPREGSSFVTGDAVNVAARLEQAAAPGEILAGGRTVTAAAGRVRVRRPGDHRGQGEAGRDRRSASRARAHPHAATRRPRPCHRSLSVATPSSRSSRTDTAARRCRTRAPPGGHPGRCRGGQDPPHARDLELAEQQAPEPIRRTGRTLSYGQGTTYWPLAEVLKEHFGIAESDPPEAVAAALADRPYLGLTLGLTLDEELHPLVARERLHDAWVEFLGELVRERPVVLLVEDMHWAEDDLCDLLDTLVAQVQGPLARPGHCSPRDARPPPGLGRRVAAHLGHAPRGAARHRYRSPGAPSYSGPRFRIRSATW